MNSILILAGVLLVAQSAPSRSNDDDGPAPVVVVVPLGEDRKIELGAFAAAIAKTAGVEIPKADGILALPTDGLGGALTRTLLQEALGVGPTITFEPASARITIPRDRLGPDSRPAWERGLKRLIERVEREKGRRNFYGLWPRESYRPNDPSRPTVCLIHGMNSTSSVFLHMVEPIERAGYGVVVYDYPYNRDVEETVAEFRRDWDRFRTANREKRPWALVSHSMGALLARELVEGEPDRSGEVASSIMIAPVNGGSYLAQAQTALQFLQGVQAVNGKTRADALAFLGDGLGAAAEDLTPGSRLLRRLDSYRRRPSVGYHIIAGDVGLIRAPVSKQIIGRLGIAARLAGPALLGQFEELTDGTGDGCVAVERSKLAGVADHEVVHADHLELIRAPLIYPDPGPVVAMPFILDRLATDLPVSGNRGLGNGRAID